MTQTTDTAGQGGILRPGDTCWRMERADRLAVIVDAADYFRTLRDVLKRAQRTVYLIGWDFDLRIEMVPGESDGNGNAPDGLPNRLGPFLDAIVQRSEELDLYVLQWDGAMLAEIMEQGLPTLKLKASSKRIHIALDSHHPVGATHHQKIAVVDDAMAFCGGIDVTMGRWDTREHLPNDPRRSAPNGDILKPWHDVTTALEGPVAKALGDLARMRWHAATGEALDGVNAAKSPWPEGLEADFRGMEVAIARTQPRYKDQELINEIERLYLAAIRSARASIYLESQYLAAGTLIEALEGRLAEPDGPELVVVNPRNAQGFLEDEAMHSVRSRAIERLRDAAERGGGGRNGRDRLAVLYPANASGEPIYVHAKVLIVDDGLVRVGSSNVDNRSLGFDTECDVAFEADTPERRERVGALRASLLAEHMACEPDAVIGAIERHGSLIGAIGALNPDGGRGLHPIEPEPLDPLERALADSRILDPRTWPRNQQGPTEHAKHAAKRAMSPYHWETVGVGTAVLAVGAVALGAWAGARLARTLRERREDRAFPAPAIMGKNTPRPYGVPYDRRRSRS